MAANLGLMSVLLAAPFLLGTTLENTAPPLGAKCRQEIRSVDDRADADVRDVNRLIALLEGEVGDTAVASGGQDSQNGLRAKLDAAKKRRSEILDKQHEDLNAIRARCDRLRDERQRGAQ